MFTISGKGAELETVLFPHVDVSHGNWEVALISLATYHSIPNVETGINDRLRFGEGMTSVYRTGLTARSGEGRRDGRSTRDGLDIILPEGIYQIEDIHKRAAEVCKRSNLADLDFRLHANNNTFRTELFSSPLPIDFTAKNSIGPLMGFTSPQILEPGRWHIAESAANIQRTHPLRVVCNVAHGSVDSEGRESHVLHSFFPTVEPGFQIIEAPTNLIYLPICSKQLKSIKVRLEDEQTGRVVNLRGEHLTVTLHLRSKKG